MYENKQTKIEVFESELRDRVCRKNDEDCVFSDLTGLYVDIIGVISERDKAKVGISTITRNFLNKNYSYIQAKKPT